MTPERIHQSYTQLEAAARTLVDVEHTHCSGEQMTAARLQLEVALLTLEQQHMLADIDGYQHTNSALELEIVRLEQLNAIQATQIVALIAEVATLHASALPYIPTNGVHA